MRKSVKTERSAMFPVLLWKQCEQALAALVRTAKAVEGWHLWLTALFQGIHPPVSTFLEKIKLDACNPKFNFHRKSMKAKKNREMDDKFPTCKRL